MMCVCGETHLAVTSLCDLCRIGACIPWPVVTAPMCPSPHMRMRMHASLVCTPKGGGLAQRTDNRPLQRGGLRVKQLRRCTMRGIGAMPHASSPLIILMRWQAGLDL